MLNDPLNHVYEGHQLPTFTVAATDGYYVFYTNPSERNVPQLRSYTFIPRDTSNIRDKMGRIYEKVPKLFSE
ncbi:MAG: hypothetical protein GF368_01910 [Candidatus Aenigmarchaeota archaeon]|nr:hypothetical protein [Candidatus Aenigmarchaeota archaeon]